MFYARFFAVFFLLIFSSAVFAQGGQIAIKINPLVDLSIGKFSVSEPLSGVLEVKAFLKNNGNTVIAAEPVLVVKSRKGDKKILLPVQFIDLKESKEVKAIIEKSFFERESITLELRSTYYPFEDIGETLVKSAVVRKTFFVEPPESTLGGSIQMAVLELVEGLPESTVLSFLSIRNKSKEEQRVFLFSPERQNLFFSTEAVVPAGSRKIVPVTIKMPQKSAEIRVVALSENDRAELSLPIEVRAAFPSNIVAFYHRNLVSFFFLDLFYSKFLI